MHAKRVAYVLFPVALFAALASLGCASLLRGSSSSSGDSEPASYRGTVTVENRSQSEICSINTMEDERRGTETAVQLSAGGTATFVTAGGVYRLQLMECGTHRLLYGDPLAWIDGRELVPGTKLQVGRIVVLDPNSPAIEEPGAVSVSLVPHEVDESLRHTFIASMMIGGDDQRPFMPDSDLAGELLTMLQRGASAQGWNERFETAVISVPDWVPVQARPDGYLVTVARDLRFVGGARWPDGHCTVQSFGARQPFDGDEPQGVIGFNGIGDQLVIPCPLLDAMAQFPSAASSN